jgi:tripartite-type tricarboxylate transporter receptor subunit TctC
MFSSIPLVTQHIKNGRLKLLGVSSAKRWPLMPEVPTISEAGVPDYESTTWFGLLAPAKTPPFIIAQLNAATVKAANALELKTQLLVLGYEAVGGSAPEFGQFIRAEAMKNEKVVRLSGAKVD